MSDQEPQTEIEEFDTSPEAELEYLKNRAKLMGIEFGSRIGLEKLRAKVEEALKEPAEEEVSLEGMTKAQRTAAIREKQRKEQMKLVRVRIANLDPSKRELRGDIYAVANKYLGTVRKFIPFGEGTDNGYHIPHILYEHLKSRKFLQVSSRRDTNNGNKLVIDQRWVPEFAIEVLPPLTEEELAKLAASQAAAGGVA